MATGNITAVDSALASINAAAAGSSTAAAAAVAPTKNEEGAADRFLKLLVAQMQNQDPLNPMDNAQVTSQMAQIQTVSGIEELNKSIGGIASGFNAMQAMQGAALVGRGVSLEGSALSFDEEGFTSGSFDLASAASSVKVEIMSIDRKVIATIDMKARGAGRHSFGWELPADVNPDQVAGFRINAKANGLEVAHTPYQHDRVLSAITSGGTLALQLQSGGTVPYSKIQSFF